MEERRLELEVLREATLRLISVARALLKADLPGARGGWERGGFQAVSAAIDRLMKLVEDPPTEMKKRVLGATSQFRSELQTKFTPEEVEASLERLRCEIAAALAPP